uniref:RNase H type-1 domain-containing protein n=1 Tax=Brassica oleracea TaxID=3712 RepID=A0A3P6EZW0_BRAOL|nr:unnamed protein product [Brassica oleracea]
MIDGATRRWNLQALEEIFVPGDVQLIAASQPIVSREDSFTWKFNRNGLMSEVDKEVELEVTRNDVRAKKRWLPPEESWLMCNVAFEWNKDTHSLGGAWVVRNHRGVALTHSRRAFSRVGSLDDARLKTLLWALESMMSMRYDRMVFAGDFKELFLAFQNPHKWPALRFQVEEMRILLSRMKEFQLKKVSIEENGGASFIAQSITRQNRSQSYVAIGHPSWLGELFVNECRSL